MLFRGLVVFLFAVGVMAAQAEPEILPGFQVETLATLPGFVSSVVTDSRGVIYCTTTDGWIHRIDGSVATPIAFLPTHAEGNGGLLGMAMLDDEHAVVHYTTWEGHDVLDDVIAEVRVSDGSLRVIKAFPGDVEFREHGVSSEHHGGNPTVAADGSIFVGIGEYGVYAPAQDPKWNGGKIWKLDRDGNAEQFARGVRNPFDLAWDPRLNRLVLSDNGFDAGDEIHVIDAGANCGWPETYGNRPPFNGSVPPVYVWPATVAPTGLARLSGLDPLLGHGYLSAAFVTSALYYFEDIGANPVAEPTPIIRKFGQSIMDATEGPHGEIYFVSGAGNASAVHRLHVPAKGDCNGDGLTDARDILPTIREIDDGDGAARVDAQKGAYRGSWGCDANADDVIDSRDVDALVKMVAGRRRTARH
ncbi:MAG TPA: PQQ-dependent sugar dehydrogenase [Thermoanaerobaculia bacterium]|nr:PQQ-dependent sugar dehydrogenase [Thermoanaerobaculia bacterium]